MTDLLLIFGIALLIWFAKRVWRKYVSKRSWEQQSFDDLWRKRG